MFKARLRREDNNHDRCPDDEVAGRLVPSATVFVERSDDPFDGTAAPLPAPMTEERMRLEDFPRNEMPAACKSCGRILRFRTHRLIAEYGRKEMIADALALKSQAFECDTTMQCEFSLLVELY
jgi:hypothetical protein